MRQLAILGFAAVAVWLTAEAAPAELLRCVGHDGKVVYTDQKATCPSAKAFEPDAAVQAVSPSTTPDRPAAAAPARSRSARLREQSETAQADRWRQKRAAKEAELEQIAQRRDHLAEYVTWCNRGGYVLARDEAGIKQRVSCTAIRAEFAGLDDREAKIRAYLQTGLAEECRKAGCLPGWVR